MPRPHEPRSSVAIVPVIIGRDNRTIRETDIDATLSRALVEDQ